MDSEEKRQRNKERSKAYYYANQEKMIAQSRAYKEAHQEELQQQRKERYEANKEQTKAESMEWKRTHRESTRATARKYHWAHQEEVNAKRRAYGATRREELNARQREYNATHRKELKASYIRRTYGLSREEWNALFETQSGCCAICKQSFATIDNLKVDHCHNSEKVRGLLCSNCNTAIGLLKEDINVFQEAIEYLRKHNGT